MSKPYLMRILALLVLISTTAAGQDKYGVFNRYLAHYTSFSRVNFLTEERYLVANPLPDSINVQVDTITDLHAIINKQLRDKVYAVEIQQTNKKDLEAIFDLLTQFKNLTFLKLSDPLFPNPKDRPYQLPQNVRGLQQLKAFEFNYTDKLDVDDALDKLKDLKQLNTLGITGYHPVILGLGKLPGVKHLKLASKNLLGVDVSKFAWETLQLSGSTPNAGPDKEILAKLPGIKTLTRLNLEYYSLGDAEAIPQLKQLSALSFNICKVSPAISLFSKLSSLKNLSSLSVSLDRDSIQTLKGLEQLNNLQHLSLMMSSLEKNPEQLNSLRALKNLKSLDLLFDKLTRIPDIFSALTHLKKIRVDGNLLEQLPPEVFNLPQLEYLDVSSNKLRQLPAFNNYKSKNLKVLNISYNALTTLPAAITTLTNLERLDARGNKLVAVNGDWRGMVKLKEVSFSNNMLATFPAQLHLLSSLEHIDVGGNEITTMPDITVAKPYNLKSLIVEGNQLTALPEHIGRYTKLETLQAGGNRLTSVPESLGDCQNIKLLDFNATIGKARYDADKTGNARFVVVAADSSKFNNIKNLPTRLKGAPQLTSINLANNTGLNSDGVFDILLARPRKNLRVNLRNTGISALPNNPNWAGLTFFQLDLSNNKLQTLPPEFAKVNTIYEINLAKNQLMVDGTVYNSTINNKADMKILFDELGVKVAGNVVSDSEYAAALTKHINAFKNSGRWQKGVEYARKAMSIDATAYSKNVRWDNIGTCRFNVNDYVGAIEDFDRFLAVEKQNLIHIINFIDPVIRLKAKSHLALGQPLEAAKTYAYYYERHGKGLAEAAVLYKAAGNEALFKSMLNMALSNALSTLDANKQARPKIIDDSVLDYAELLLIANRPDDAIEALTNYAPAVKPRQTIKSYLLATAGYLKDDKQFDALKTSLSEVINVNGKINNWDFELFNTWLQNSGLSKPKQEELMYLQNMAK